MGSIIPTWRSNSSDIGASTAIEQIFGPAVGSRKRSASSSSSTSDSNVSTKRFKLNTFDYVYQKLFVEGLNSDVQVHALGHTWRLHRFYLEQCDYFRALFQGNWCDSSNHEYTLDIEDENICFTGLNNVFASLYNNEIEMDEEHISGVCGAASLLNLTSVLDKCNAQLAQYVRDQSKLLLCLKLADRYGFEERMAEAMSYLKLMFCQLCTDVAFLRGMTQPWLIKLLSADVLCVRENELGLYTTIRNWIFLNECPDGQLDDEKSQRRFFHSADFQWRKYADLLRQIRVPHLVTLQSSLKSVTADGLIPMGLLDRVVGDQWRSLLQSEESPVGGSSDPKISDQDFYANCFRLGRTGVNAYSKTSWRWRGYFFGVDLLVNYDFGFLRLTRNCTVAPIQHQISIKHVDSMKLHYRCIICSEDGRLLLDTQRQSRNFPLDRSVELGAFKLLPKGESISVHLFYLPFLPIRQPPTHYWDQLGSVEEQQPVDT